MVSASGIHSLKLLAGEHIPTSTAEACLSIFGSDPVTRASLCSALRLLGFDVKATGDEHMLSYQLREEPVDLLLVIQAPGEPWQPGRLDELQSHSGARELPVIVLCEGEDRATAVAAMEDGVRDAWLGPMTPAELAVRVRSQLRQAAEMRRLRAQVCIDELTGIFNRRGILGMLERETNRLNRTGSSLGILLIDVDHFKHINDTYGHSTGDSVLRAIGDVLMASIRRSDAAGRLGGDEFLVVLPEVDEDQAHQVAERIRSGIARIGFTSAEVSASIGVAVSENKSVPSGSHLIDHADRSMYRRKRANTHPPTANA